jgi:transcriptional regulator with XRE-family HTH domain
MQPLADWIRTRRKSLGLSQAKLASRCGWEVGTISMYERGLRSPSTERFKVLCQMLGAKPEAVLGSTYFGKPTVSTARRLARR